MRKSLIIFILLGGLAIGGGIFNNLINLGDKDDGVLRASSIQPSSNTLGIEIRQPDLIVEPVSFSIPKLGVENVKVESVGLDKENKMDIPRDENNVAWYNMGAKPGELGNAVIAGHFDKKSGAPAVFYNIGKLIPGDELLVRDRDGKERKFAVTEIKTYSLSEFPLEEVFGLGENVRLNLITCEGEFNPDSKLYSHRLVVYSELKND